MQTKSAILTIGLCLIIMSLTGCAAPQVVEDTATIAAPTPIVEMATIPPPSPESNIITVIGVLTTVWNGGAHYSITDEEGKTFKLQLDEELTKPLGGPLAIDRQKVTITGELVSEDPPTILVLSIQFAR